MVADVIRDVYEVFDRPRLFHLGYDEESAGHQSKYAFGVSVAEKFGFDPGLVRPVSWKDGGLTARRSPNLIMNTDKLHALLGHDLPGQQECLDRFFRDTAAGLREQIRHSVCPDQERNENGNQDR